MTAIVLTIAGSDSGGGAGIQADLKAVSALGCYGASVITAVTAQNTKGVQGIAPLPVAIIRDQLGAVLDDLKVAAVKIGMLGDPEVIATVAKALAGRGLPIVLDPVMVAKSGDRLLAAEAVAALRETLLPMARLLTPNQPEAADLLGEAPAEGIAARKAQGEALLELGADWVLMKGGHVAGPICTDLLLGESELSFSAPRIATKNTHGTGCTLSAAIAAGLARGEGVPEAVGKAHHYLQAAIARADELAVGQGQGPVHHFHAWWPR